MKQTFEIFLGTPEKTIMWLGSIGNLVDAQARLQELESICPGDYFVCASGKNLPLAEINSNNR